LVKLKLNEDTGKIEVLEKGDKDGFYMDGLLKSNLDLIKSVLKKDWDFLLCIDGEERAGKSVLAQQIGYYLTDGKMPIENICFTPKEFRERVINAPKYSCIVFDEAFRGVSSRGAMSETNKVLCSLLQEIGQKNLIILILLPSIWDLDKYVSLHRCKGLIHVHTGINKERGFFKFYKKEKITFMMANRQKMLYRYPKAPQFKGRFAIKNHPIDEAEYKRKKSDSLMDFIRQKKEEIKESRHERSANSWKRKYSELMEYSSRFLQKSKKRICGDLGHNYNTATHLRWNNETKEETNLNNGLVLSENKED